MNLPEGYQTVMPYLILKGIDNFIAFAKDVFGAKELNIYRDDANAVVHAEIRIGDSTLMMGESGDQWGVQPAGLYINVEDADETFNKALEKGAKEVLPVEDKEYGRSGGVKDPFGNTWWITSSAS